MKNRNFDARNVLILWRWEEAEACEGLSLNRSVGGQMNSIAPGDRLFICATYNNELYLLGSIDVHKVGKVREKWSREYYGSYEARGESYGIFSLIPLRSEKWKLRFQNTLSTRLSPTVSIANQVRSHRFLTPQSAALLSKLLSEKRSPKWRTKIKQMFNKEGAVMQRSLAVRERDPAVRKSALQQYGRKCMICELDFVERYGEFARNCMEVHHLPRWLNVPAKAALQHSTTS